ncbi:MAG: hypothetical protein PHH41_03770 [Sulfurimonas sp.]|nr:hypothetical protein [Sulfurimonas sp.]MDD5202243.1 hypothetical protein [Sulfurimonas sp.]
MKKIIVIIIFVMSLYGENFQIKEDGKVIEITFLNNGSTYEGIGEYQGMKYNENSDILVSFKEITPEIVDTFEAKYDLKFKQILVIGYYIYGVNSNINDVIQSISKEENIHTVKPNWTLRAIKY